MASPVIVGVPKGCREPPSPDSNRDRRRCPLTRLALARLAVGAWTDFVISADVVRAAQVTCPMPQPASSLWRKKNQAATKKAAVQTARVAISEPNSCIPLPASLAPLPNTGAIDPTGARTLKKM